MGLIDYIKRKRAERIAREETETPQDKWSRITASATRRIGWFTLALVAVAVYQFIVLNGQLDVMRQDQRAWIFPRSVDERFFIDKPLRVGFTFINSGKIPASDVKTTMKLEILDMNSDPTFDYSDKDVDSWFWMPLSVPNQPMDIMYISAKRRINGTRTTEEIIWTKALDDQYHAKQLWLASEIAVTYRNAFGSHWITECYANWFHPTPFDPMPEGAAKCIQYNHSDSE